MGGYFSQEEEPSSPDSEECLSTTPASPFAKYFTFLNDPRSPNIDAISRTPILVQDPLVDPRSPTDIVERTPVYACASTPIVRFFGDNEPWPPKQDTKVKAVYSGEESKSHIFTFLSGPSSRDNFSADSDILDSQIVDPVDDKTSVRSTRSRYKLDNRGYEASPASKQQQLTDENTCTVQPGIAIEHADADDHKNGDSSEKEGEIIEQKTEQSNVVDTQDKTKKAKNQLKKRFNATQKSFLKTVLFKPYEELDSDMMNTSCNGMTPPKKVPLGLRNDACNNGDTPATKESVIQRRHVAGKNSPVGKLPLKELSIYDKENMA